VALLIAAAVILGGVIVVAVGRGGELVRFPADVSPFETEILTAADIALLVLPSALFGYNPQATDDALSAIARTVTERDVEIARLRQQVGDLQAEAEGAATASRAAAASRPPPGPRPSTILRGLTGQQPPPPQSWSAWESTAQPAVPPGAQPAVPPGAQPAVPPGAQPTVPPGAQPAAGTEQSPLPRPQPPGRQLWSRQDPAEATDPAGQDPVGGAG
jgi:hypothetical protein